MNRILSIALMCSLAACSAKSNKSSSFKSSKDALITVDSSQKISSVVYYDFDSENLHSSEREKIKAQSDYALHVKPSLIFINGHTDSRGSHDYNYALGIKRANTHKKYLIKELKSSGVSVNKNDISIKSFSYDKPAVPKAKTESDHAKNRRSEVIFKK